VKPSSYSEDRGSCAQCCHVFKLVQWTGQGGYYCHHDKSDRPTCGSGAMGEYWTERDHKWEQRFDAWEAWAKPREVVAYGWCEKHEKQKT